MATRDGPMEKPGPILEAHQFFRRGPVSAEGWSQLIGRNRDWESFYRERWQHDKVVRSSTSDAPSSSTAAAMPALCVDEPGADGMRNAGE